MFCFCAYSQTSSKRSLFSIEPSGSIKVNSVTTDWNTGVFSIESPVPGSNSYRNFLELQKSKIVKPQHVIVNTKGTTVADKPILQNNFLGNNFNGIPNDNDMAISNNGVIVSVTNSFMQVHNDTGLILGSISLDVFTDSAGWTAHSFDPKVIYDPAEDKFILIHLSGSDVLQTNIIVSFSETNDPLGAWNVYSLPGNPLSNNTWSDYPIVAITQGELFISMNLIHNDSTSWITGFAESIVWQVDKFDGYNGNTLNTALHHDMDFNGKPIRNLCPIQAGTDLAGPDIYLLSNRNFDLSNDTFFVVRIPNDLAHPTPVQIDYALADEPYGLAPNALQKDSTYLQTNDSRVLGGFIEDGEIHFTGNSINLATAKPSVFHGIIELPNINNVNLTIISDSELEYGYPNMSYTGRHNEDMQAIISFNHTSMDSFAGVSAIFYSKLEGYSERKHIVSGENVVSLISGNVERWGDYSGNQRKYNEPGVVWMSGFFAKKYQFGFNPNAHAAWIAKMESPSSAPVAVEDMQSMNFRTYPNPFSALIFVEFENEEAQIMDFELYDASGRLVRDLMTTRVKKGKNIFRFSMKSLDEGNYWLLIKDNHGKCILMEKVIRN